MRPTIEQVIKAVEAMGAPGMVKFFPNDDIARELIVEELYQMVPSQEALNWLVSAMVRAVGEWQSLKELRALLGTRYTPRDADSVPTPDCSLAGFTPEDSERQYFAAQAEESQRTLEGWRRAAKGLPAAEQAENRKLLGAVAAAAYCPHCQNSGLIESPRSAAPWTWCDCGHAVRKRALQPDQVEQANAAVAKLLRLSVTRPVRATAKEVQLA